MQIFVPYSQPIQCAEILWNDSKRYNKQIIECKQILNAINETKKGWINHPITKMYKPYKNWLIYYMKCFSYFKLSKTITNQINKENFKLYANIYNNKAIKITPFFLTEDFCNQHKKRLFTKNPQIYHVFAQYGTSEENWYVINGKLLKYIKGKLLMNKIINN